VIPEQTDKSPASVGSWKTFPRSTYQSRNALNKTLHEKY